MLPLSFDRVPLSPDELASALQAGLKAHFLPAASIVAEGASWPALHRLAIDLTDCAMNPKAGMPGKSITSEPGVKVSAFELLGNPLMVEETPVSVRVEARDAVFGVGRCADGSHQLVAENAGSGEATIEVQRADLENTLRRFAEKFAAQQGVELKAVALTLQQLSPRSLQIRAEVQAKMFVMKAVVSFSADLSVDETLTARCSNLKVTGDGMVASMASGFAKPYLDQWEGRTLPLAAFSLAGLHLRDIAVHGGDSLRISAKLGD